MAERTLVHAFTDGRDVSPHAAAADLRELVAEGAQIATVCGRYYAMDRDQRWERTERAFGAIVEAEGDAREDIVAAIEESYERGVTDEFLEPIVTVGAPARAGGRGHLLQLPARPGPPADPAPARRGVST